MNQNPEQKARDIIDKLLIQSGWVVQDKNKSNLTAGVGVAIREYQTDIGPLTRAELSSVPSLRMSNLVAVLRERSGKSYFITFFIVYWIDVLTREYIIDIQALETIAIIKRDC